MTKKEWWKESVVYQIYPRSFNDSNGDGIGDLKGIMEKLDYLKELGVDVIWLSPVYQSPNDDNGYDISDYQSIMDEFGTMQDFEELLQEIHKRDMKLMMDLVVNHTSDEHEWFRLAKQSKDSPYRDYYYWKPGKNGAEPNNWESVFSGSAWEYDEDSNEYYLHIFSKKQPDLNWENPKVRSEVFDTMKFWLEKGIDGFRMDVINFISKVPSLPDAPALEGKKYASGADFYMNGPKIHEYLQEMNQQVLSKYDLITVGEMPGITVEQAKLYTGEGRNELNMVFQFEHVDLDSGPTGKWDLKELQLSDLKASFTKWQKGLEQVGWNSLYLNNHDQPRMVSRFGNDDEYWLESAKMLATFLHFLQGTPYIYQGEELGMTNVRFPTIDDYKDIETLNMYNEKISEDKENLSQIMNSIYAKGRDNARTPMQWSSGPNAGFTSGTPWIKVNPNYQEINAEQQLVDDHSIFQYYKKLIQLRKQHEIVVYGTYDLILPEHSEIYAFTRTLGDEKLLIILNFSDGQPEFEWPQELEYEKKELLISNYSIDQEDEQEAFKLLPYEARVYKLT
ncbi:glycoside hydrolase family 13 protein [Heyndrickxia oleronia]|uniref:oligo-1,6-glucosidase n=1 Tax=Heyndrickxia oleronia TaxID=38875 RepID=A0A8E2LD66_9BACI|nr:alpha-glucosidase [Heyndrickxia oleronia]NYV67929.1 alpha-glucosidase [Bacillus sp. Gen3]MBU5212067.1 alpha-glucosidase [Heyndrickxia oleronia]MCI1590932.1 alpha-glucosidase [Heyndrickxia oleronia]MCI1612955.1 alpha-glucosidase [Heyndrickxia oleronia]MCI1744181.1 alpha-glucosidase [Heyndrickxia oleronia]